MSTYKLVRVERTHNGDVLEVTLDSPETGNAFSLAMIEELTDVFTSMQDDRSVRAMVLSGAGENFGLGGQRSEFEGLNASDGGDDMWTLGRKARRMCSVLAESDKVKIAKVHGKAVGAGFVVPLLCNLRVATQAATFRLPEAGLGVPPAWGGILGRLIKVIGHSAATELVLTSRVVRAEEARQLGVVHAVVPDEEGALDTQVERWLRPMLRRRDNGSLATTVAILNAYADTSDQMNGAGLDIPLLASSVAMNTER
ncbi:enoyl-CoA hydratase/isomerase family protein [Streptomyces tremellae]|uniref:Isohexenylglutaconyl-CoA hydratase n=1 Tax=Streptomyces tremellae TaxID=1124239 RepID=A0ABP7FTE7_9ACTN